ncbi:N-acetylmuramoyl-L-alanine amidase [Pelotomaculum propionicicum]|uniref:N-acetylmuramoyl-L-alanine amidase n=1 Tax=Pelotomaculum propionicicum TaxID=258475 RepID=UPI003B7E8238
MHLGNSPRITNLWSKVVDGENGEWLTRVVVESTRPYEYTLKEINGGIVLECAGADVNMPEGKLEVNDGLLRDINIEQLGHDTVRVQMALDHPAVFKHAVYNDFPSRLVITLERSFITGLLSGKRIVVDPGHGGKDFGGRGPVSLLEKNVVLPIARNLEKLLKRTGAEVTLTRSGDEDLSGGERAGIAVKERADAFISIHTNASADSSVEGAASLYAPLDNGSEELARYIQEEIIKKLKVMDRGVAGQPALAGMDKGIPAVEVEIVTITNIVEEVFLRGLTIQKRAAEGIVNGLIKYFASDRPSTRGDKE